MPLFGPPLRRVGSGPEDLVRGLSVSLITRVSEPADDTDITRFLLHDVISGLFFLEKSSLH